jgi:hypothetical protein
LEKKGFLRRINRVGQANLFDLTPLFGALEKFEAEMTEKAEREQLKAEGEVTGS